MDERDRPLSSFLVSVLELEQLQKDALQAEVTRSLDSPYSSKKSWHLPQGRHVLMAACRDIEEASEYSANGQPCGAFSYFLLETLQKTNSPLTYRDLFNATATKIRSNLPYQSPQIEALNLEDLDQPFLGGLVESVPAYFTLAYSPQCGWHINGGAVHGIQSPWAEQATELAVFAIDTRLEDLQQMTGAIATATVIEVQTQMSCITTEAQLDIHSTYKAVVTYLPSPPLTVVFEGEPKTVEKLRQAIQQSTALAAASSYINEVTDSTSARIRVVVNESGYIITRNPAGARPITTVESTEQSLNDADKVIRLLSHISRWLTMTSLAPPVGSQLSTDAVELQIYQKETLLEAESIRLAYEQQENRWRAPSFKAKLVNHTSQALYCTLLNLTEEYSVSAPFFNSGGIWLDPHSELWITLPATAHTLSTDIPSTVPQQLWEQGVSEYQDRLMLIASTAEFDATILLQDKIDNAEALTTRSVIAKRSKLFRRSATVVSSRDLGSLSVDEPADRWMTSQRIITTVRPQMDDAVLSRLDRLLN